MRGVGAGKAKPGAVKLDKSLRLGPGQLIQPHANP